MNIFVTKANGEKELFIEEKLRRSIQRAGIPLGLHDTVVSHIKKLLYPDIKTSEIYYHLIEFLGASSYPQGRGRYSLKQAIMDLGPSGYPFENFVAEILKTQGFATQTRITAQGKCVSHEIDVVASKDKQKVMVECKFHNRPGSRSDVKVALYVWARFEDVSPQFNQPWLATNTKCTTDAIQYGNCVGLKIIGWGYPEKDNLQNLIETANLHPLTCLTTLSTQQKQTLLKENVVLCKDLLTNRSLLQVLHLPKEKEEPILQEIAQILKI